MELLDETTIKFTYTRGLTSIQTGHLGALHGEQSLTALNWCGMLVFKMNIIWNVLKVMISTSKYTKMKFLMHSHLLLCTKTLRNEQGALVYPMPNSPQVLIEIHNGERVWHVLICILGI